MFVNQNCLPSRDNIKQENLSERKYHRIIFGKEVM
jgi:hypothetical protein